ncbi:hypothetical protein ACFL2H_12290 [Planctomycetota bacterium]
MKAGEQVPDHELTSWKALLDDIYATPNVRVAILNHARDEHTGVTPFGPLLHNAVVGETLEGGHFGFNAMEVVNSSSTQTDINQSLQIGNHTLSGVAVLSGWMRTKMAKRLLHTNTPVTFSQAPTAI